VTGPVARILSPGVALAVAFLALCAAPPSHADVSSPLFALVDAAAQRLQTADAVSASKWITKGPIEDPARERQVIDGVREAASARGVDPGYVQAVFRDQIDATVGIEYARFSDWKLDPADAPQTAPDLSDSRGVIDGLNRTMVTEVAAQWDSLHSPGCSGDLRAAEDAVVRARTLDGLYQQALSTATRSYCR
jgi:chorismate mutase